MNKSMLREIVKNFSTKALQNFLRKASHNYSPRTESLDYISLPETFTVSDLQQLGEIPFEDGRLLIIVGAKVEGELTSRSGRKAQYDIAKRLLKHKNADAGLFVFYDKDGRFRMSLVVVHYLGRKKTFSHYRRYTYFVDPNLPNKTFINQLSKADFSSLDSLLEAFSIAAVTDEFYREFEPIFQKLVRNVQGTNDDNLKWDFALLFTIRTIFLGFLQKRGWLGNNPQFLQDFWKEYRSLPREVDSFYKRWLVPLFFEALRHPPGHKVAYQNNEFSAEIEKALQMAPYLNGELFRKKPGVDDQGLWLPDQFIGEFFDFLFQYNFTVEENELYDEELEVNPEFLGIIFERLLNKDLGSVYTPRVEVDLMCRWSLVKWLERQGKFKLPYLYELFFHARESEKERVGDFSTAEISQLIDLLEKVQIVDPAAGSGAFLVGMLQVLDEILDNLYNRPNTDPKLKAQQPSPYERKKHIIGRSLYGVDVHRTAVWIAQLRLWLTLFVDLPEEQRYSQAPLLPNLAFKVRRGDSLVQRVGDIDFPVRGTQGIPLSPELKRRLKHLARTKVDFFFNRLPKADYHDIQEEEFRLFREILRERLQRVENRIGDLGGTQISAFGVGPSGDERRRAEQRKALEKQRESLQRQLRALQKGDVPFLWALEFAEIFAEKGGFDVVIGNPPYVRQEEIRDPEARMSRSEYKQALQNMVLMDFPHYFAKSLAQMDFRKRRKPSGRSDLYTYFYVRTLRLLNRRGVHTFVCSNAWLDVDYGKWLQEFLLRKVPMYFIVDNRAKRSFASSDINTVITVFGAPLDGTAEVPADRLLKFVAFRKPFEEAVYTENLLTVEEAEQIVKEADFRVFPISQGALLEDGTVKGEGYVGNKWGGKYLRAPDIFFTILEKGKDKLVKLGDIAEVRFGIKTGANEFFYLEPLSYRPVCPKCGVVHEDALTAEEERAYWERGETPPEDALVAVKNGAGWEGYLEAKYLKPVIKSPRECRTIAIEPTDLKYLVFMCGDSKEDMGGSEALWYIEWGENAMVEIKQGRDKGKQIIGYHNVSTVKGRKIWWDLGNWKAPTLVFPAGFNDTFIIFYNRARILADKRLYFCFCAPELLLFFNSPMFPLFLGILSRASLGQGLLDLTVEEYKSLPVLDPKLLGSDGDSENYFEHYLPKRGIKRVFREFGIDPMSETPINEQEPKPLPDRKFLDDVVFCALGLTEDERKEVYRAVCQLVWERISKAKSLKKRQEKKHVDKEAV